MSWKSKQRLALCEHNRHYFEFDGRPIWLSGHSRLWTLSGFIAPVCEPVADGPDDTGRHEGGGRTYVEEVEDVAASGGRLFRMTPFWPGAWMEGHPMPWKQQRQGVFDLTRWDERFFAAFRDFLARCAEHGIVVQLELWDRPGLSHWHPTRWPAHPMNPDRNVNYGTDVLPGGDGRGDIVFGRQLFYATARGENPALLAHQQAYIEKLLSEAGPYPNVIYCIENESTAGIEWHSMWARLVRGHVRDALVTAMPLEPHDNSCLQYFDDPALNCMDGGGTGLRYATGGGPGEGVRHRSDRIVLIRETMARYYLLMEARPERTRPVYVSNCFAGAGENLWAMFCCGAAGLRYHRNTYDASRTSYEHVRAFNDFLGETELPFTRMAPAHDRLRGLGLCLAGQKQAVVYLPGEEPVHFLLPEAGDGATVRLFDCGSGAWTGEEHLRTEPARERSVVLRPSSAAGTAAYVRITSRDEEPGRNRG